MELKPTLIDAPLTTQGLVVSMRNQSMIDVGDWRLTVELIGHGLVNIICNHANGQSFSIPVKTECRKGIQLGESIFVPRFYTRRTQVKCQIIAPAEIPIQRVRTERGQPL